MTHPKTVWVTKYALTAGIQERPVRKMFPDGDFAVDSYFLTPGKQCALTHSEAVAIAEKMRAKKIASLEKQIDRLRGLKFDE